MILSMPIAAALINAHEN